MSRIGVFAAILMIYPASFAAHAVETVVLQGDSLSSIASRELGDARRWPEICKLNRKQLPNCDVVVVGTTLSLPDSAAAPVSAEPEPAKAASSEFLTNVDFSDGIDGWLEEKDGDVTKQWRDGELVLTRQGQGIFGAARQSFIVEAGKTYLLSVNVTAGRGAFKIDNSNQLNVELPTGKTEFQVSVGGPNVSLAIWPYDLDSSVSIDSVSLVQDN